MQEEPQPSGPRPSRKISKKIIIIFFILILIGLGILFLSRQNGNDSNNNFISKSVLDNPAIMKLAEKLPIPKVTLVPISPESTITPSYISDTAGPQTQPTLTPNLPQNWSTYKNTSLNFTLSYPSKFSVHENPHGLGVSDITFISPDNTDSVNSPDYQILIYPKTVGKLIGQDFDLLYSLPAPSTQRMSMADQESTPQQFSKISNKTLSGLRAFDFKTTDDPPDPNQEAEIGAYIEIEDSTLIISTKEGNQAILNHILSTFKHSS